jgi:uncharacterized membrane protein YozB (DUF420 family)
MKSRLIPVALLGLAFVPVLAGSLRLAELAGGAAVLPDGDRVGSVPAPLILHIVSVTVFSVLGAFQFAPTFRRRRRGWHRAAGRVLIPVGLVVALTGLWLALFLPRSAVDSDLLAGIRVVVAVAMGAALVLGFRAVLRRDFARHRAWMIRGYAISMGAGTQFFTQVTWLLAAGPLTTTGKTVTLAAGWLINVVVAERIIRGRWTLRPTARRSQSVETKV